MREKEILLVEDNTADVLLTLRAMKKAKITNQVVVANDGVEALDYLYGKGKYAERNGFSVPVIVLLDLKMPRMDGFEVLKQIRDNPSTRRLPVIMLTSSSEESDINKCYEIGANSYVRKPIEFERFAEVVKHLVDYWLNVNEEPTDLQME
jgi:two-component system response regulator